MADVFPRRNLPPQAEQWGREVESRVVSAESDIGAIQQALSGQNRNTASSLSVLARQLDAIQQAQMELANQQEQILATTDFLSTQTVSDSKSSMDSYTGSNVGTTWRGFNSTYDCSVSVTTGSAGRLLIQASANLSGGGLSALLGIEIVGVTGPSFPGPYSTYVTDASAGTSRVLVANLSANTAYTVRLRRGIDGSATGVVIWRDQTLSVTRS